MFPRGALLYLTDACNLNCTHCGIVDNESSEFMTKECFYSAIFLLKEEKCCFVAISGGDPILHPNLIEFLQEIRKQGMLPVLGLSGVNITNEQIKILSQIGLGCIQVSLDGCCEKSNAIFRGKGVFDEVIKNIKEFQKHGINVNLAICLCKENYNEFILLMDLAREMNIYEIKVQFWEKIPQCSRFTELTKEEKLIVKEMAISYRDKYKMYDWISLDLSYSDETKVQKKFMMLPNGDIKSNETGELVGNILTNKEDIINYYG